MNEIKTIDVSLLDYNAGQLKGLPKNPRFFRDYRYEAMKKSIKDSPEMLELRELIVFPYINGHYVVVCGNLRLRASKELGYTELPCKVLAEDTTPKKLREFAIKDNVNFGENDSDILANEWDKSELVDYGSSLRKKSRQTPLKSVSTQLQTKMLFIPSYRSMTRSTSCSSLSPATRWTATG